MDCPTYPSGMPKSFEELQDLWESIEMDPRSKRMLVFSPNCEPWINMIDWTNVIQYDLFESANVCEIDLMTFINLVLFGD